MTNEEKAREISQQWWSDCGWQLLATANDAALEAMRWKDEEHAQEKQQWIEKAWNWLTNQKGERTIDDFKQAMKGE